MKKKWYATLFGGFWYKVPNFIIKEISISKNMKHYRAIRHDGLTISLTSFEYDGEMIYESGVFIGGSVDNSTIIRHESLGSMFEYAVKLGNGEISVFQPEE